MVATNSQTWIARRRHDGLPIGLLVMNKNNSLPIAFVMASDSYARRAAKRITESGRYLAHDTLHGCGLIDLRKCRVAGFYINLPAFLFAAHFNAIDSAGRILPMPRDADCANLYVVRRGESSYVRFEGYRWIHRADVPKWMNKSSDAPESPVIATSGIKSDEQGRELMAAAA